jgi:hypothetical protein
VAGGKPMAVSVFLSSRLTILHFWNPLFAQSKKGRNLPNAETALTVMELIKTKPKKCDVWSV